LSSALAGPIAIAAVNAATDPRNIVASQAILLISFPPGSHSQLICTKFTRNQSKTRASRIESAAAVIYLTVAIGTHYWARELTKLGHEVRLMPAKDVKAYVKRNKNDAADAEASEAVRRPTMRFVRPKSADQQGRLMQHRARDLLLRQQTQVINALRARSRETDMPLNEKNDPEMAYRRGYQDGASEMLCRGRAIS
jgi:hypothetical protein